MDSLAYRFFRQPLSARPHPQAECDVLENSHVAEQRVMLENEPDLTIARMRVGGVFSMKA